MGEYYEKRVKKEALQIIGLFQNLPRVVVFDLDYTLWPFCSECYYKDGMPYLFPQARGILYALKEKGIDMSIASRSPTPYIAKAFLDKLGFLPPFVAQVSKMGVTRILVGNGLNLAALWKGLSEFSRNFGS